MRTGFYTPGFGGGDGQRTGYGGDRHWLTTPEVTNPGFGIDNDIPQGVYSAFLANNGWDAMNRQGDWARSLYGRTQSGYQAALRENPNLTYREYLSKQLGTTGLRNMWLSATPDQRGERPGNWVGGGTRVIGWG